MGREARRRHYWPRVLPAAAYLDQIAHLPSEPAVVFVVSTTGQGEAPTNFQRLWRFLLRKSLPADSLTAVSTAVFGLGDSGYPQYNVMAKKLYRRVQALGAQLMAPLGLGDDQHRYGYEAELDPWLVQLWEALRVRFPLPPSLPEVRATSTQVTDCMWNVWECEHGAGSNCSTAWGIGAQCRHADCT